MRGIRSARLGGILVVSILVVPAQAQVVRSMTDLKSSDIRASALDDAGTEVFAASSGDPFGTNPFHAFQLVRWAAATGTGVALTSGPGISNAELGVSVSDDGQWVAFLSRDDPTGQNHDRSSEAFVINRDGTGLVQLTSDPSPNAGQALIAAISGNGARVAFVSSSDLTGGNPSHAHQVFLVDRSGANLGQVTSFTEGEIELLAVSDDASRLVFASDANPLGTNADGNYELFAILSNGTGLRQLTNTIAVDVYTETAQWLSFSGNGAKIAFEAAADLTGGNADRQPEIFVMNWDGTGLLQLTDSKVSGGFDVDSRYPAITDDGSIVYFTSQQGTAILNPDGSYEIWRINGNGTGKTLLADGGFNGRELAVSGSGNRLSFRDDEGLTVMDTTGANPRLLAAIVAAEVRYVGLDDAGSRLIFTSTANLTGNNADGSVELYRMQTDGTALTQVTINADPFIPSSAPDGSWFAFTSNRNLTGGNPDRNDEVFRINADGTGLQQLTSTVSGFSQMPVVSADGSTIVFTSTGNLTGGNADLSGELFRMNANGTGLAQITSAPGPGYSYWGRTDDAAAWVAFSGTANLAGGNPDGHFEVWRIRANGTGLQQITNDPTWNSFYPDISGDGTKIVFTSEADLTGGNPDHSREIFLWNVTTSTMSQLTDADEGQSIYVRLSHDGAWAYFFSDAGLLEPHYRGGYEFYRVSTGAPALERVEGLGFGLGYRAEGEFLYGHFPAVDRSGSHVVFSHPDDSSGTNPDVSRELFLYDRTRTPAIRVSSGPAPTRVAWDVESGPVRYDLVRGDVVNLAAAGPTVSLGAVTCVENDSPDADTAGNDDGADPPPGHAFFYVYRGTQGIAAGAGSYGQGTGGRERVAASGDCAP